MSEEIPAAFPETTTPAPSPEPEAPPPQIEGALVKQLLREHLKSLSAALPDGVLIMAVKRRGDGTLTMWEEWQFDQPHMRSTLLLVAMRNV